jgi:hypothetical protein
MPVTDNPVPTRYPYLNLKVAEGFWHTAFDEAAGQRDMNGADTLISYYGCGCAISVNRQSSCVDDFRESVTPE